MDRLVKEPFLLPAPAMPGDKRIAEHETDFVDHGHGGHFAMSELGGNRIRVAIEAN